jgi:hypothetical protein
MTDGKSTRSPWVTTGIVAVDPYSPLEDIMDAMFKMRSFDMGGKGLGEGELRLLRTRERLNADSLRDVSERLRQDTLTTARFMRSLAEDMTGTLDTIFDLTPLQKERLERAADEELQRDLVFAADTLALMAQHGTEIGEFELEISGPENVAKAIKHKFEFGFELDTEQKGKVAVKYVIEF